MWISTNISYKYSSAARTVCFRVLVKNENRRGNTRVSYVAKVYVEYEGHVVELFKDRKVLVSPSCFQ